MADRLELHKKLCELIPERYSPELKKNIHDVYFQPSASIKMQYPAIIYKRARIQTIYADDHPYAHHICYQVTVIYQDPDSDLPMKIADFPLCSFDRHYTADNLNHDVFTLYH